MWRAGPWGGSDIGALLGILAALLGDGSHLNHPSVQLLPCAKHCSRHREFSRERSTDTLVGKTDKKQTSEELLRDYKGPGIKVELTRPLSQSVAVNKRLAEPLVFQALSAAWGHTGRPDLSSEKTDLCPSQAQLCSLKKQNSLRCVPRVCCWWLF